MECSDAARDWVKSSPSSCDQEGIVGNRNDSWDELPRPTFMPGRFYFPGEFKSEELSDSPRLPD